MKQNKQSPFLAVALAVVVTLDRVYAEPATQMHPAKQLRTATSVLRHKGP